jgi:AcrR family transcriptional regulator
MSRPRQVEDGAILAAAARRVAREGPLRMRLADVAADVGVTASALVQRFGSKRDLLLALAASEASSAPLAFRRARAAHASPLAALEAALAGAGEGLRAPEDLVGSLAFLQLDLTDEAFRRHALAYFRRWRAEVRKLLAEAVAAGDLAPCDPADLARAVEVTYNGSLLAWALRREGSAATALRHDLHALLAPRLRRVPMA